jgi:signal transduction histidine kinase
VTRSTVLTTVGRLWPRRLGTRLAVFYSVLFFLAGLGLLVLAYALAVKLLVPPAEPRLSQLTPSEQAVLGLCKPLPTSPALLAQCQHLLLLIAPRTQGDPLVLRILAAVALVVLAVCAIGLGRVASDRALKPVRSITEAARRASELRLSQRLALPGPDDELKQLGDTFDLMLEKLDAVFSSQQRFVANAAHELRTPLTAMRTAIEVTLLRRDRTPEQLEEMANQVKRSVERAEATIEALLTLATSEVSTSAGELLDLATAAEDALDANQSAIRGRNLTIEAALEPAPTRGDRVLLERMVANLVDNAVRHNNPGGWIGIRTRRQDGNTLFEIANTGPEVRSEQIPTLFEPFARANQRVGSEDGAGLGLSIADAIGRAHAATITAQPRPEGGLEIVVTVPGRPASTSRSSHAQPSEIPASPNKWSSQAV